MPEHVDSHYMYLMASVCWSVESVQWIERARALFQLCVVSWALTSEVLWQICLAAPITMNLGTLDAYKKLVQMERVYNDIPLMYFIVEPFSLSMLYMARYLPISLLGLVLARNESECFRAVKPDESLTPR